MECFWPQFAFSLADIAVIWPKVWAIQHMVNLYTDQFSNILVSGLSCKHGNILAAIFNANSQYLSDLYQTYCIILPHNTFLIIKLFPFVFWPWKEEFKFSKQRRKQGIKSNFEGLHLMILFLKFGMWGAEGRGPAFAQQKWFQFEKGTWNYVAKLCMKTAFYFFLSLCSWCCTQAFFKLKSHPEPGQGLVQRFG